LGLGCGFAAIAKFPGLTLCAGFARLARFPLLTGIAGLTLLTRFPGFPKFTLFTALWFPLFTGIVLLPGIVLAMARIFTPGFFPAGIALLLIMLLRRGRQLAGLLNAAQSAAQLFHFPFIRKFLTFRNFDEFENFVKLINHLLERLGNARGQFHGVADGGGFSGAKISGFNPRFGLLRLLAGRLRTALWTTFPLLVIARLFRLPDGFGRLGGRFRGGFGRTLRDSFLGVRGFRRQGFQIFPRFGFVRSKISGNFRVRFAKIAGSVGLVAHGFLGRHGGQGFRCAFCGGHFRFRGSRTGLGLNKLSSLRIFRRGHRLTSFGSGARTGGATTATATATPATAGCWTA